MTAAEDATGIQLRFPDGIFGFPECRGFSLSAMSAEGAYWLQSTDHPALGFVVLDPFAFLETYTVDLSDLDLARLQPNSSSDVAVLVIVTLGASEGEPCSVNLQGPIAFNVHTGIARQVIQAERQTRVKVELQLD